MKKPERVRKFPEQGACMRSAREEKGLTQFELSYRSGVSLNTVQNLENGYVAGNISTIRQLVKTLKITIDEYVGNN